MPKIYKTYPLHNYPFAYTYNAGCETALSREQVKLILAAYPNWRVSQKQANTLTEFILWYQSAHDLFGRERLLKIFTDWHLTSLIVINSQDTHFTYQPGFDFYGHNHFTSQIKEQIVTARFVLRTSPNSANFCGPEVLFGMTNSKVIKKLYRRGFTVTELKRKAQQAERSLEKKIGGSTQALRYILTTAN
jgi:hypothetical protein